MTKWQYKILDSQDAEGGGLFKGKNKADIERYLNDLGEEGWEIINIDFHELATHFEFTGVAKKSLDLK